MSTENHDQENEKEPTPEELKQMRDNMLKFYEEEIPLLEKKLQYERLAADIEEQRYKRISHQARIAHMLAPPPMKQEDPSKIVNDTTGEIKTNSEQKS